LEGGEKMRIEAMPLKNRSDSKVQSNELSIHGVNFSGLLSQVASGGEIPKESIRNRLEMSVDKEQSLSSLLVGSEQLLELKNESYPVFIELISKSEEIALTDQTEIIDGIQSLVYLMEDTEKGEIEPLITELLASLPIEVRSNIEQMIQSIRLDKNFSSVSSEFSKPESTLALLVLLAQSVQGGEEVVEDPSISKLLDFVKKQLETLNLSTLVPNKEDLSKVSKKLLEITTTVFQESTPTLGNRESDNKRSYLQSVFSRYFVEPNGLRLNQNAILQNQNNVGQTVLASPEEIPTIAKAESITQTVVGTSDFQGPMTKVQQFSLFVEQQGRQSINQEQFIKEFQNILARSQFGSGKDGMKLLIKLYPEHLGSLRIELLQKDNMMIARIIASSGAAKDVLESQIQSLKQSFSSQNIQVEKIEISQQLQQSERSLQKDSGQNSGQGNRQMNEQNQQEESETTQSFETALQEELNVKV
jgi:flagellar hook-length control protein FliK